MFILLALRDFCIKAGIPRARVYIYPRGRVRIRVPREHVARVRRLFRFAELASLRVSVRRFWPGAHDEVTGFTAVFERGISR